jgi:hypothetical protein
MNYSQTRIENGKKGEVVITYTYEGNALSGWYAKTYYNGRCFATRGTASSGGKKPFKRLTKAMLVGYSAQP